MRDIKFRGEDVQGVWRIGGFTLDAIGVPRITTTDVSGEGLLFHRVIPETVGEFTGLKDKNGVEIFEGDVVKYFNPYSDKWITQLVKWDDQWACFGLFDTNNKWCQESDWVKIQFTEVIGNIHDNPELLK